MKNIHFYSLDRFPALKNRTLLRKFIIQLFKLEKTRLEELSFVFCSDTHLLEINRKYLKHDFYTDVITFELGEAKNDVVGEVYISVDRIKENAKLASVSFSSELHRVMFHGCLHLCGYSDKKKKQKKLMKDKEDMYLGKYFK